MKNKYELTILFKTSAAKKDTEKLTEDIRKIIKAEGKILKEEDLGKKILAYAIKKEKEANYRLITLEARGEDITKISSKIKMEETVLRHLIIRLEEDKKSKSQKEKD